jgi:hypothetical protein
VIGVTDVTASAHQSDHGRDQKQDHGDKEDRLGDFDGDAGDTAEAQNTRDQRDDQKRNDPAQHDTTSIGCCSRDGGGLQRRAPTERTIRSGNEGS